MIEAHGVDVVAISTDVKKDVILYISPVAPIDHLIIRCGNKEVVYDNAQLVKLVASAGKPIGTMTGKKPIKRS